MTSAFETAARPAAMPGDTLVLTGRPLRDHAVLKETSRYADDVWVLTPAWLRADQKTLRLDFTLLPPPLVDVAKPLFLALLAHDAPPGELPLPRGGWKAGRGWNASRTTTLLVWSGCFWCPAGS